MEETWEVAEALSSEGHQASPLLVSHGRLDFPPPSPRVGGLWEKCHAAANKLKKVPTSVVSTPISFKLYEFNQCLSIPKESCFFPLPERVGEEDLRKGPLAHVVAYSFKPSTERAEAGASL